MQTEIMFVSHRGEGGNLNNFQPLEAFHHRNLTTSFFIPLSKYAPHLFDQDVRHRLRRFRCAPVGAQQWRWNSQVIPPSSSGRVPAPRSHASRLHTYGGQQPVQHMLKDHSPSPERYPPRAVSCSEVASKTITVCHIRW